MATGFTTNTTRTITTNTTGTITTNISGVYLQNTHGLVSMQNGVEAWRLGLTPNPTDASNDWKGVLAYNAGAGMRALWDRYWCSTSNTTSTTSVVRTQEELDYAKQLSEYAEQLSEEAEVSEEEDSDDEYVEAEDNTDNNRPLAPNTYIDTDAPSFFMQIMEKLHDYSIWANGDFTDDPDKTNTATMETSQTNEKIPLDPDNCDDHAPTIFTQAMQWVNNKLMGRTPLHLALLPHENENPLERFEQCLANNPFLVNTTDSDGNSPLMYAASLHEDKPFKQLLKAGADACLRNEQGKDVLFVLAEHNDLMKINYLFSLCRTAPQLLNNRDDTNRTAEDYGNDAIKQEILLFKFNAMKVTKQDCPTIEKYQYNKRNSYEINHYEDYKKANPEAPCEFGGPDVEAEANPSTKKEKPK